MKEKSSSMVEIFKKKISRFHRKMEDHFRVFDAVNAPK